MEGKEDADTQANKASNKENKSRSRSHQKTPIPYITLKQGTILKHQSD